MCIKLDLMLTHLPLHSDLWLKNKLVINNFIKHLISSYRSEWKKYCHQGGNFYFAKFICIDQVSVFYSNVKMKLIQTFLTLQKGFTKTGEIIALQIVKSK